LWIYKRLIDQAQVFTGMLAFPARGGAMFVWTIVAGESAESAGMRDAIVGAELLNIDAITIDDYDERWSQDIRPSLPGSR
jgi:hypothetical protein